MKKYFCCFVCQAMLLAVAALFGCRAEPVSEEPTPVAESPPDTMEAGEHEHGHEGPHGGHLIELGRKHEYHAELAEDAQNRTVTIYLLDKDLKPLPIDAKSVTLNLVAGGQPQSIELAATDAADGKASTFASSDSALFQTLENHPDATGHLRATIAGVPYTGEFAHHAHDHDHEGHSH